MRETAELVGFLGLSGIERAEAGALSYGGQRLLDMGLALASAPRVLLLDEPLAGLAAAERERVGQLIKRISADVPVLLVEHDIDRVFALADRVTVMNDGAVLFDGDAAAARDSSAVREIYIGSGTRHCPRGDARGRVSRAAAPPLLALDRGRCLLRQEPHRQAGLVSGARARDRCAARAQRRRQVDAAEDDHRDGACRSGRDLARRAPRSQRRAAWQIARDGVGYVPQGRALFAGMSVRDNLALGRLKRRQGRGRCLVRREDPRVLSQAGGAARHTGRLPLGRRAADGRGRARSRRPCPGAVARRAVRGAGTQRWSRSCSKPSIVYAASSRS